jgi:hypothetical protein
LKDLISNQVSDHQYLELAPQKFEQLGAGAVNFIFIYLILAPGNGTAARLHPGCQGIKDHPVYIQRGIRLRFAACFYQAA